MNKNDHQKSKTNIFLNIPYLRSSTCLVGVGIADAGVVVVVVVFLEAVSKKRQENKNNGPKKMRVFINKKIPFAKI